MNNIIYRRAKFEDVYDVAEIHTKSWKSAYKGIVPSNYLDKLSVEEKYRKWTKETFEKRSSGDSAFIVAELQGEIIGFALVGLAREKFSYKGELYAIYLAPEYYGQNIAKPLFDACIQHLKDINIYDMYLWVLDDNFLGKKFYEKMGGKHIADNDKIENIGGKNLLEVMYGFHF